MSANPLPKKNKNPQDEKNISFLLVSLPRPVYLPRFLARKKELVNMLKNTLCFKICAVVITFFSCQMSQNKLALAL